MTTLSTHYSCLCMSAYCSPLQISIFNFSSEYLRRQTLKPNEMKERTTPYKSDPKDDIVEADERAGEEDKENKMGESFKGSFFLILCSICAY